MKQFSKISARFTKAQKRAFVVGFAVTTIFYSTLLWWPELSHFLMSDYPQWTFVIYLLSLVTLARYSPDVAKSVGSGMIATGLILLCAVMIYFTANGIAD